MIATALIAVLIAVLATSALATPPGVGGRSVSPEPRPVVVRSFAPVYPAWAVGSGMETVVELSVLVGTNGRVSRVRVVPYTVRKDIMTRQMRASFDSAAVRAVRGWFFRPQLAGGRPVAAWASVKVPFEDPRETKVPTTGPAGRAIGPPPRIVQRVAPIYPMEARSSCLEALVQLHVRLDDRALPEQITVDGSFDGSSLFLHPGPHDEPLMALFDSAAVAAARQWRYEWVNGDSLRNQRLMSMWFLFVPDDTNLCVARTATTQIVGAIRDSVTGQPIEFANVIVLGTRIGTLTDSMGRFSLVGMPEGVAEVQYQPLGYERTRASVRVSRGSRAMLELLAKRSRPQSEPGQ